MGHMIIGKYINCCGNKNERSIHFVCEDEKMRESYREEIIFKQTIEENLTGKSRTVI